MKRSDVREVQVTYSDGTTIIWVREEIREGHTQETTTMDSKEGRNREQWDVFTVHVAGHKQKVKEAPS